MAVALLNDGTVRVWHSGGDNGDAIRANPTLGLTDVVQAVAGTNNVMCITSDGTLWKAGNRMGGFAPFAPQKVDTGGEKVVMIGLVVSTGIALTESGKVIAVGTGSSVPPNLPLSGSVAAGGGGFALGKDGIWRAWDSSAPDTISAQAPSFGLTSASGSPYQLHWVDGDGRFRMLDSRGHQEIKRNEPNAISCYVAPSAGGVEIAPGEWKLIGASRGGNRDKIEELIQGCSQLAASRTYLFGIRPLGR